MQKAAPQTETIKRGRPRLPAGEKRRQHTVWLSATECAEIDVACAWMDQDRGVYLRESALARARKARKRREKRRGGESDGG